MFGWALAGDLVGSNGYCFFLFLCWTRREINHEEHTGKSCDVNQIAAVAVVTVKRQEVGVAREQRKGMSSTNGRNVVVFSTISTDVSRSKSCL